MNATWQQMHIGKRRRCARLFCLAVLLAYAFQILGNVTAALAQQPDQWTPQQTIPNYHNDTNPPYLIADQNRTVHAFSSQWLGEEEGDPVKAILYNHWQPEQGWSTPIDILLSSSKEARILDVFLDQKGMLHLIFYGGDETDANIYYSQAPATMANLAPAWSPPVVVGGGANNPEAAALAGDDHGHLVIIYSGQADGWGLYTLYSMDDGASWTEATPTFLTYDEIFPVILKLYRGQSGLLHAVWDLRNKSGQGRQIIYAHLDMTTWEWSKPAVLVEADTGYGVLVPTVIEYQNDIIVAYSGVTMQRSSDGGQTWSDPISPFRQVGVNGVMSFVVDSNNILHFLWAQRITGDPDIHGVWHSRWEGGRWTEPVAVVSGPQIADLKGEQAFDPYEVHAVASQGNLLLATWRSDPGNHGNGVWYSYTRLDTPELPLAPLPTLAPTLTPTHTAVSERRAVRATATDQPIPTRSTVAPALQQRSNSPAELLITALIPVILLVAVVLIQTRRMSGHQSK